MSKINRIRIMNLNYNGNAIRVDDETFDLNGKSTLLSLRNGGGKTVLVQMIISLFVNKTYRDFTDRPFKSYFTTSRPTFILTEWKLDHGQGYFLAGMMVRKCQNTEENNEEELEMLTFTSSYQNACSYDLDSLPVLDTSMGKRILKGFGDCKKEFERLKKDNASDFAFYDMSAPYQRKQYFSKLREYQINNKEWESIIKKVNLKESGLSELFANAKDEKGLIEKWFLDSIEKKLNQEKDRIREFQALALKLIRQYRENQTKIRRKEVILQYFEDAAGMEMQFGKYKEAESVLKQQKSLIAGFIKEVDRITEKLSGQLYQGQQGLKDLEGRIREIEREKISYQLYQLEDERMDYVEKRVASELRIASSEYIKKEAEKELCRFQCGSLYAEAQDFKQSISRIQENLRILLEEQKDSESERNQIGGILYHYYQECMESVQKEIGQKEQILGEKEEQAEKNAEAQEAEALNLKELSRKTGCIAAQTEAYNQSEARFNKAFKLDFSRNIVGEYEEGFLSLKEKQFEDEVLELSVFITRLAEQALLLKQQEERASQEGECLRGEMEQCRFSQKELKVSLTALKEEKFRRNSILRQVEAPEQEFDNKVLLMERLGRKIEDLETIQGDFKEELRGLQKEFSRLSQGRTVELTEGILEYFESKNIPFLYGMEWLKKNGRTLLQNQKLAEKNPFLPYSIIIEKKDFERLKTFEAKGEEAEIYTDFPVPVIVKEELELAGQKPMQTGNGLLSFECVSFFVLFNKQLLDPVALKQKLEKIKYAQGILEEKIQTKTAEIAEYRGYWNEIGQQKFTQSLLEETERKYQENETRFAELQESYAECGQKKKETARVQEETRKKAGQASESLALKTRRGEEFKELVAAYQKYLSGREEKKRLERSMKETEERIKNLKTEQKKQAGQLIGLREEKRVLEGKQSVFRTEFLSFKAYEMEKKETGTEYNYTALKARYESLTKGISSTLEELEENLEKENVRYEKKCTELKKRNKYQFAVEDYRKVLYSGDQEAELEKKIEAALREENVAKEENSQLEKKLTELETRIQFTKENLKERTGGEELVPRNAIVNIDFEARKKLADYEKEKKTKAVKEISDRLSGFQSTQDVMAEYTGFEITGEIEIPALLAMTHRELNQYQGMLRRDLKNQMEEREKNRRSTEAFLRKTAERECYQEDFFQKGFEHMMALTGNIQDLKMQADTISASYASILKKLEVDLENIDKERKNIEEIFLEYVRDIDDNMRQIDKNSSIAIRGRSKKMLKIMVPDWEGNREHYQIKMRDYVETFIQCGMEAVEQEQNVEELLGKYITTRKLYDEVAGIGNIGIRLYKIEAEREVEISWKEVSANSGGEGFLSAFVILSCLLSYMRREESDLFSFGEEGKVLVMDNPFAQTNAEHLLKPLMDMAKKTNTQLICLSGLGGDSIYNRFDNIYVLKVMNSNMRKGFQYLTGEHLKGEEYKKMDAAHFEVEQLEFL